MPALDQVLAMRPRNAAARLGPESRLPLLGANELVRALEGSSGALATLPAIAGFALPAYFRAARESDAVIGVSWTPLDDRKSAPAVFEAIRAAAEEGRHRLPFFLQAGPFVATARDERSIALLSRSVFDHLEAGFTMVSIDTRALGGDQRVRAAVELARPALERELAVEVAVDADPVALGSFVEALNAEGMAPSFLRVSSAELVGAKGELDIERAGEVASAIRAARSTPSLELRGTIRARNQLALVAAGFRKIDAGDELAQRANAKLASAVELAPALGAWRQLGPVRLRFDELDEATRDRLEAFAFGEATELIAACKAEKTGKAAVASLAATGPT